MASPPKAFFPVPYVKPWFAKDADVEADANMDVAMDSDAEDSLSKNGHVTINGDVETTATTKHHGTVGIPDVVTFNASPIKKTSASASKPRAHVAFMKSATAQLMLDEPGLRKVDYQQKARIMWRDHKAAKRAAKPRTPTAYNMYIKNKIVELKAAYPGKVHQEYFMDAIEAYRQMRREQVPLVPVPTSEPMTTLTPITLADVTNVHIDIVNKLTPVAMPRTP